METLADSLQELRGLFGNRRQAAIYLALLEAGATGIEKLHKETGIHSETIQRELRKMTARGTVTITRSGRNKKVQAVPVAALQESLEASKEKFDLILKPLLEAAAEKSDPKVSVVMGDHALALLQLKLMRLQPRGEEVRVISAHPQAWREAMVNSGKLALFERERLERKVGFLLSCFSAFRGQVELNNRQYFPDQPAALKRKYRYIETADSSPLQIQVWQSHVVISIFSASPSVHIVFEDTHIKKAMRSYFDILWRVGTS